VNCLDLGTVNGTFVNEMRLSPAREPSDPVFIRDGDIIRIVHYRFKVKYYEHPALMRENDSIQSPSSIPTDNNRVAYKIRTDDTKKVSVEELIAELQNEKAQLKAHQVSTTE
jgi:pSer/pThr/pTyr-binding forkhead associated (FHA) protein